MINVIIIIIVNINNWLFNVKYWIVNHLGINPKKGGSPPNDNKFKNKENFKVLLKKKSINNWLIWYNLNILNKKIKFNDKNL